MNSASQANAGGARKLHDKVAVELGTAIANGRIPEGSLLPTEQEGVQRFGVSRATYREAIRALSSKGLVTSRAKTGTRVNPRHQWAVLDPEVITWMFSAKPTTQAVRSLFELRMIIEPAASALAAERRTAEQLLVIGHAYEEMARHGYRSEQGQAADARFHELILTATDNDFLIGLTESIATAVRWTTILKATASKTPRDPIPLHFELYRAIADRNPERAREAALTLLEVAREDTEALLR
ncbi:MAG: FadR family transcriptional regulator [Novosphingobium sp.]|nr:FadR family transcriptional regulator [Novosphingobium sp.]